ncbi:MAG TPA: hypothetical protein DCE41_11455 [Cytophagales bacterium]|nr:hypothetical protein [Cytophagales bacterium]HAA22310.1 hypothetical protein [Cytophagales bacterium]HAP60477.1 hypothetical protein [Cytophagales bacterium]
MKKKLVDLLLQIIPVMIGVYLGFLVSNWSDRAKSNQQADLLVSNILQEVITNREKIERTIDYHEMVRDSSQYYAHSDITDVRTDFFKGTKLANLTHSAYDTGIQTGIINGLSIEQIQLLNQLYTVQETYNDYVLIMMQGFLSKEFSKETDDAKSIARFLSVTMTDIVYQEQALISLYQKVELALTESK